MTSSFTGGISAPFNVLLQRGLNLLDVTDPVACRQNIGALAASDLKTLTFGSGLVAGSFNATAATNIVVDSDATGAAGKVVKADTNGDLTTTQKLNFGTSGSFLQRATGTNGAMLLNSTGTGALQINNNAGPITLVAASTITSTSVLGTKIGLTSDPLSAHTALVVDGTGGNTGSLGLSVTKGATIDTLAVAGALTGSTAAFSGAVSGTTGTFSGAVSATTGTFSGAVSATTGTFSGAVSGTTGAFSDVLTGTTATFSRITLTAVPSFCIMTSADASASSALFTTVKPAAEPLAPVVGFPYAGTIAKGCTQTAHVAQITFPTAGRYVFTFNGSLNGNGGCYFSDSEAAFATTSIQIYKNTTVTGTVSVNKTFILDVAATDVFFLGVVNTVASSPFTLYAGSTLSGYLIG